MTDPDLPLLRVQNLTARYGARVALRDVTLEAHRGECIALCGPNGAGKTTFIRAVLGLLPPATGRIDLFGHPIDLLSIRLRARQVAWVPQEEAPHENIPLLDYVLFGRYPHLEPFAGETEIDHERAREALVGVDLWERRDAGILEVSGGERQRVLLARALAQDTPILLLDEPTAHLDISHQLELLARVRDLCHRSGRLVVAAMHDLNLAARFADRLVVLHHGRLVADGTPGEVLSPSLLREVWGIVAELRRDPRDGLPYLIPSLPAPERSRGRLGRGSLGTIHVVGGGGAAAPILRRLAEEGYRLSTGALHLFDTDSETAQQLGVPMAVEVPFAPLGSEVRAQHKALLAAAYLIVVAPFVVGPANLANLEDLRGLPARVPVLLLEPPASRPWDFTNGRAGNIRKELLREGARTILNLEDLLVQIRMEYSHFSPGEAPVTSADAELVGSAKS